MLVGGAIRQGKPQGALLLSDPDLFSEPGPRLVLRAEPRRAALVTLLPGTGLLVPRLRASCVCGRRPAGKMGQGCGRGVDRAARSRESCCSIFKETNPSSPPKTSGFYSNTASGSRPSPGTPDGAQGQGAQVVWRDMAGVYKASGWAAPGRRGVLGLPWPCPPPVPLPSWLLQTWFLRGGSAWPGPGSGARCCWPREPPERVCWAGGGGPCHLTLGRRHHFRACFWVRPFILWCLPGRCRGESCE